MAMNTFRSIILVAATMLCTSAMAQQNVLDECVYWIDHDISTSQQLGSSGSNIDVSGLSKGLHSLTMQVKDSEGLWSSAVTKYFVILPDEIEGTTIATRQFWFDNNVGNAQTLGASVATVDLSGLTPGLHSFTMRVQDDAGLWSNTITKYIIVPSLEDFTETTIDHCRYWFNDSVQNAQTATLEAVAGIIDLDISHLAEGEQHTLYWQVRSSNGAWSKVYSEVFTISVEEYLLGDVNNDENVDIEDVNIIINVILHLDQASNYGHRCYVTDDETVDIDDVNAVINIILGIH